MNSIAPHQLRDHFHQDYLGLAALLRLRLSGADLAPMYHALIERATKDPQEASALMDAAIILQFLGNPDFALTLQQEALKVRRHYVLPAKQPTKLRLLALMAPGPIMANIPLECLLENADIELHLYFTNGQETDLQDIPDHDVLFVAIGESGVNHPILTAWLPRLANWPKPVLINPRHIERVARHHASELLHGLPGVLMPPTLRLSREALRQAFLVSQSGNAIQIGFGFPIILRPVDSHAGHDLYKIENHPELLEKLASLSGDDCFVSPFIDYRSADGLFRKYRVILIDGKPYACHMAISSHWMIHYLNAGMAESAKKREEEARFMANFDRDFAVRHGAALAAIHERIGLEYLGIDCAETADGRLLIFEVDPAMVVHAMDPVDLFPYKQEAMRRIFDAFRAMLLKAASAGGPNEK